MADWQVLAITGAVILGIVFLIVKMRINPVVSLIIGAITLGLATGMSPAETTDTVMHGFGDILYEVGLLIAWGVLMGSILNESGAIARLVDRLMAAFGKRGIPFAFGVTLGTVLQSIFLDVLLVMTAPLARRIAPTLGRLGTARMATAMAIGLECGIVLMVPGVATMALAGLLGVPLGKMLIFGTLVIVPTIISSIAIMNFIFSRGWWNPEKDESPKDSTTENAADSSDDYSVETSGSAPRTPTPAGGSSSTEPLGSENYSRVGLLPHDMTTPKKKEKETRLVVIFAPMLLALVLIGGGALLEMAGVSHPVLELLSSPVVALLIGLLGTSFIVRKSIGRKRVEKAVVDGFRESGQILILTGAGGSLASVVATSGMGEIMGGFFSASTGAPLLTVWVIAAILHIAVGSVSISAITAAGLLAPVAPIIGLDPVLLALAAGAGSLFMVHVTSNTFWLLQSMLGQTTRGTLKSCSVGVSVASVMALIFTLILSLFL
ncbi:GntP family permease [Corynebacterium glutamicum]|uniref:GntP family permease n=1 Tax=Corynebacterium glutamicum TaxID=1718 RepID=UPI000744C064|nr:SLC13 family permease [Corynebacterium glutamicum]AMA00923.1 gluconate permease [Corynebacterium glutamicum]